MARHLFDLGIFGQAPVGTVTIYTDRACTAAADIQTAAGATIAGAVVTVPNSKHVTFYGPNNVRTLYTKPFTDTSIVVTLQSSDIGDAATEEELDASVGSLLAQYAPVTAYGSRMVVIGHSIAAGQYDNTAGILGQSSWANDLAWLSNGRIRLVRNSAVSGTQSSDAITNFATYVTPYKPNVVLIQAFTNDINNGATDAQLKASLDTLIGLVRGIGAQPIIATELPRNDDATKNQRVREWNYFVRKYAPTQGARVLDAYKYAVNSANGQMITAYVNNVIHLTAAGAYAVAKGCWADLAQFFPNDPALPLPSHQGTLWSDVLLPNGQTNALFLVDGNSDGKADGTAVSGTATLVSGDTTIIGNWQQSVIASGTNGSTDTYRVPVGLGDATNFPVGNTITVACRFQVPAANAGSLNWGLNIQFLGSDAATVLSTPAGIQNGVLEVPDTCAVSFQLVIPANAYYVRIRQQQISGTGTLRIAQVAVVNDTARNTASI